MKHDSEAMWFSNMANWKVLLFCLFVGALFTSSSSGGVEDVDLKDPEVLKALSFAMDEYNKRSDNLFREMATEVKEATKQIVAGKKFCIVAVIGTSSCRKDDKHESATLEACPVDSKKSSLYMVCKFDILVHAPWEKDPQKMLGFACDDLNAETPLISCHRIAPYHPIKVIASVIWKLISTDFKSYVVQIWKVLHLIFSYICSL